MIKASSNPKFFILSSVCAGSAHLTRQDGVLLLLTLVGVILLSNHHRKIRFRYLLLSLGIYLIVLSPLLITNYRIFGAPFPPGPSKTMFLTQYEDLYSYSKQLTLANYWDWGVSNIIVSKLQKALSIARQLYSFIGGFLAFFIAIGILGLILSPNRQSRWRMYLPPLLFLGFLYTFYTLIATFPGSQRGFGFHKSGMAIIPFLVVIAIDSINKNLSSKINVTLCILLVLSLFIPQSIQSARTAIVHNAQMGERLEKLKDVLVSDAQVQEQEEIVIMARSPWEVFHTTRFKSIQIPNENIEIIYKVAQHYGANYLLLPAPREALRALYTGDESDDRFQFVGNIPGSDMKLFRIVSNMR